MELWQRIGTYAAGLALDSGHVKSDAQLLTRTDMIVACGGGERDTDVDSVIMTGLRNAANPDAFLNERLMGDLRPTLFLAQLSNLLAGNISIVHGVTGSSRTFMGEEAAGIDAVRVALSRIIAGQSQLALVGGAHSAERQDILLLYEFGGYVLKGAYQPVWERRQNPGFAPAAPSSSSRSAGTPRRAGHNRTRGSRRCFPATAIGPLARSPMHCAACGMSSRRNSPREATR